jgi:hypothetical protein
MKTQTFIYLFVLAIFIGCTSKQKNPMEGSWKLAYFKWTFPDSTYLEYPGNVNECTGKWMLLDSNSLWYFRYKPNNDSAYIIEFGDMIYKFDGKIYQETYLSAQDDKFIGKTFHYNISIENDSLTLSGPGEGESEELGCVVLEKFIRY